MTETNGEARQDPWFADGLGFKCTGCGNCCTGSSRSVYLSQADLGRLAEHLHMPIGRLVRKYTLLSNGHRVLVNATGASDCVFLTDGKTCSIDEARPTQCRTYPWWLSNIRDEESWEEAGRFCEGINHPSAPVVPAAQILEQSRLDLQNESE